MIADLIASIREAVREWKHRRAIRHERTERLRKNPLPF